MCFCPSSELILACALYQLSAPFSSSAASSGSNHSHQRGAKCEKTCDNFAVDDAGSFADEADVLLMVKQHSRSNLTHEALQVHAKTLEADADGDVVASLPRTPSGGTQNQRLHSAGIFDCFFMAWPGFDN